MKSLLTLASFFLLFTAKGQTLKSFGFDTGIADSSFYRTVSVYNFNEALKNAENVIAVTFNSKDSNLSELKNLKHLQYLYLDETFFLSSVNLKKQKTEAFFSALQNLNSVEYISTYDPSLLPYISKIKSLKGLCCNTFDNALFNSLKNNFSNLELFIVNDPAAETVNVTGLNNLRQLEIYSMYMSKFDESICDILTLQALRIKPGKLQSLPKNFSRLKNLSYFSLTGSAYFNGFPYAVMSLTNLQTLEIDLREVKKIPDGFAEFKNLQKIIFNEAQKISLLPDELSRIPALKIISLSDTDNLKDVSALTKFNHPYTIILNRCNYVKIAKELQNSDMMIKMVVPKSIYKSELEKLKSLIPENKLLLAEL